MQPRVHISGKRLAQISILLGGFVLVASIALLNAQTSSPSTQAKITWSQNQIEVTLSPGESTSKDITFSSSLPLQNAVLEPVPEIAPFVTGQPLTFPTVPAGQSQLVHLSFSVPAGAVLGTYQGTIHLRIGKQTAPQTVKVVINVWQQLINSGVNLTVYYPPAWSGSRSGANRVELFPTSKPPDSSLEYVGDIVIEVIANPDNLSLDAYYATIADVNLFQNSAVFAPTTVNGAPAVKFNGVFGMIPTDLLAISRGGAIIELSDVGRLHQTDGYLELIAGAMQQK